MTLIHRSKHSRNERGTKEKPIDWIAGYPEGTTHSDPPRYGEQLETVAPVYPQTSPRYAVSSMGKLFLVVVLVAYTPVPTRLVLDLSLEYLTLVRLSLDLGTW